VPGREERVNALTLARAVALGSVLAGAHDRRDRPAPTQIDR